jgi:hypothetical protein
MIELETYHLWFKLAKRISEQLEVLFDSKFGIQVLNIQL